MRYHNVHTDTVLRLFLQYFLSLARPPEYQLWFGPWASRIEAGPCLVRKPFSWPHVSFCLKTTTLAFRRLCADSIWKLAYKPIVSTLNHRTQENIPTRAATAQPQWQKHTTANTRSPEPLAHMDLVAVVRLRILLMIEDLIDVYVYYSPRIPMVSVYKVDNYRVRQDFYHQQ